MGRWSGVVLAAGICGCFDSAFACQEDGACPMGRCEAEGWCSFPDDACPSGWRFGDHAAAGLAGECVSADTTSSGGGSTDASTATLSQTTQGSTTLLSATTPPGTSEATSDGTNGSDTVGAGEVVIGPIQIAADPDDGGIYQGADGTGATWVPSGEPGNNGYCGEFPGFVRYGAYFRFELPREVPESSVITDARLSLYGHDVFVWDPAVDALAVWLQDDPDAAVVTGVDAYPGEWRTEGTGVELLPVSVRWLPVGGLEWEISAWNVSDNLAPLLRGLISTYGTLERGSYLQFWVAKAEPMGDASEVGYTEFAKAPDLSAMLEITYAE